MPGIERSVVTVSVSDEEIKLGNKIHKLRNKLHKVEKRIT